MPLYPSIWCDGVLVNVSRGESKAVLQLEFPNLSEKQQNNSASRYWFATFDATLDTNDVIEAIALPFLKKLERGDFRAYFGLTKREESFVGSLFQVKGQILHKEAF